MLDDLKMDKTVFSVGDLNDASDDQQHWLSKTPMERLYTVELMRQMLYGYDPSTVRLQRFFEVVERP
jgi:hypothetical protein